MICGCIDIGSNTTRVLVGEADSGRIREVLQHREFTQLGRELAAGAAIPPAKLDDLARVVAEQRALAEAAGAVALRVVATAAIRAASNRDELVAALQHAAGVDVCVLDGAEEARLAFVGATRTLGRSLAGRVGVVDVGGGSTELAVGTMAAGVEWSQSFRVGSGVLADRHLRGDPPAAAELEALRVDAAGALAGAAPPPVAVAVAVGGSAASLRRLVGAVLEPDSLRRALEVLSAAPAAEVARRYALDPERVRLLPAGILTLEAAGRCLGRPLEIGNGGLREGVLLELAGTD
jgi:exopolyphosphatase / guanosine-5'-triphosphate,3'-diphosphate pyrophosphatase